MASRKYQKHTHHQHILELPDTYVGSTKTNEETRWIYDAGLNKMVWRKIHFNPGLYKIFDEIVVNARDEFIRSVTTAEMTPIKHIDIAVTSKDGDTTISIENDGNGIPIEESAEHGIMIPELIFGNLLTSSNYDKTEEKIVGGKNGYGSKCLSLNTNIPLWQGRNKKAKDIQLGDTLIGDDGTPRKVLNVFYGEGQMYEVQQAAGDSYKVNDQHILTLHMPDHKVIFWNGATDCWTTLWWDNETKMIRSKKINIAPSSNITCPECNSTLHSNLKRHYKRLHPGKEIPEFSRKSPTKIPENSSECREARHKMEEFCKTIPDNNVFDISIADYMALNDTTKKRLAGVRGQCVQWPTRKVELDPYILGLWLGDGFHSGYGYACYGEKDPELIEYLENWCSNNDAVLTKTGKYTYNFSSALNRGKKGCAPLKHKLEKYNLIKNKHIPDEYIINDRKTRLAVLAGLIDTDGHVMRNGTRISITQGMLHEQLVEDIVYLARSLGFSCQLTKCKTGWSYKGEKKTGEAFKINISGSGVEDIPTRLPRKKCASTKYHNTSKSTGFLTIQDAGIDEYIGIQIDGNERFIINDFTVTHNCTNILSKQFIVDIRCPASEKQYSQTWKNNMLVCEKPNIKKSTSSKGYVKISFTPDSTRFNGAFDENGIIDDMVSIFHTRAVELAALVGNTVKVTWNGTIIPSNTFEKFIKLFLRDGITGFAYEECGPRWEIGAILARHLYSDDDEELPEDKHISFANGINTKKGGKHVDTVTRKVLADFCEFAKKKKVDIKPGNLKHSVVLFINATIVNPSFDSQSKEFLTTPPAEFGSKPEYTGKLVDGLNKLGLLEEAKYLLEAKTLRDAKKTDGKKRSVIRGMTKLEDALLAGTAKSRECTLILTEGDSAATSAISGLKEVGRERWGVFPLRGKLLNVRDITVQKFNANEELTAIKKILGLEQSKSYKDISELRYGRVMVMADQDHDGSHIKGLLMNLFHAEWPSLMRMGFLCTLLTPILKTSKGKITHSFYSIPEFNAWKDVNSLSGWKIKYYKGLGTSTPAEAREWFKDLHEIKYEWDDDTDASINLAFNKKQADDRKKWLSHYDPTKMLIAEEGAAKYTNFVNNELIHFSNADNIRSLPHLIDGLKPSQRKILYSCFKRNLKDEIRVAQLAGYVSEHAAYHHGEASLNSTIVGMAQNFVGSNNINLLKPAGQHGCLSPDTEVLLWNGNIKTANNIIEGDILIGDDGLPRTVLKTTSGYDTMYEIIDEQSKVLKVNSQHILTLQYADNFKIKHKPSHNSLYFNYFNGNTIKGYSITFNDNITDSDHFNRSNISRKDANNILIEKVKKLQQIYSSSTIIDIKIEDYLKLSKFNRRGLYMISNLSCIEWEKKDVSIDPYILGAWLGDGDHMGKGFTSCDEEIIKSFVVWLKTIGAEVSHHASYNHDGYHYSIRRKDTGYLPAIGSDLSSKKDCSGCKSSNIEIKHNTCDWVCKDNISIINTDLYNKCVSRRLNPFTQLLRDTNLYGNKHIPTEYIINDKETRLQLLAGFIDTDGTIKLNNTSTVFVEISQSKRLHKNLIYSLEFIAKSLGYSTSIYELQNNKYTTKEEECTMLTLRIMGNNLNEIPTRISRKKISYSNLRNSKTMHFTKFTVKCVGEGQYNGWSITGNERFLLGNFVVTHNSRLMGGQDAASPRYIHTYLEEIVSKIFRKEDACLLKYLDDDGETIEPEYYLPVVPLLAINGSVGIGTGYSTDIPPHKPDDIVTLIRHRLMGYVETLADRPLDPWWWGFKGKIVRTDENTWITKGLYEFDDDKKTVTVTELPVGTWTKNYKAFLDGLCESEDKKTKDAKRDLKKAEKGSTVSKGSKGTRGGKAEVEPCGLKGFDDLYNDVDVKFILYFTEDGYDNLKDDIEKFEKRFKLTTSWKTTNMTCFDSDFNIVKYKTIGDILEAFVVKRLPLYEARRLSILDTLKKQIEELDAKRRFIQAILDDKLILQKKSDEEIVEGLKECEIPPLSGRDAPDSVDSYEYVLRMRIDRVKKSAVIELDSQITEKQTEIERLEAETGSSLWLTDLTEFDECWKKFSGDRIGEVTTSTVAKVANGGAGLPTRRRKPVVAKK